MITKKELLHKYVVHESWNKLVNAHFNVVLFS